MGSSRAVSLNSAGRRKPRRLIRAIEISLSKKVSPFRKRTNLNILQIGLTASRDILYKLVDQRVVDRIAAGAAAEDPRLAANPASWGKSEHAIVRHQLTWFKKQPHITWFDISVSTWDTLAIQLVQNWYNNR